MTTRDLDKDFSITYSTADRIGGGYACDATLFRRKDNSVVGCYRGEGKTATKAQAAAYSKAKDAYYLLPPAFLQDELG